MSGSSTSGGSTTTDTPTNNSTGVSPTPTPKPKDPVPDAPDLDSEQSVPVDESANENQQQQSPAPKPSKQVKEDDEKKKDEDSSSEKLVDIALKISQDMRDIQLSVASAAIGGLKSAYNFIKGKFSSSDDSETPSPDLKSMSERKTDTDQVVSESVSSDQNFNDGVQGTSTPTPNTPDPGLTNVTPS